VDGALDIGEFRARGRRSDHPYPVRPAPHSGQLSAQRLAKQATHPIAADRLAQFPPDHDGKAHVAGRARKNVEGDKRVLPPAATAVERLKGAGSGEAV
jgi:hypothetical protein